jgi:predicted ATPase/DNA-binding SARP family transcriptional activator
MATHEPGEVSRTAGLPLQLTRFVGRDRELEDLSRLLPGTRLLTLTGAGGSGKTRLAYEAAARTDAAFETIAWVDLAPVTDCTIIPQQIALQLGVAERPGVPTIDLLSGTIGQRRVLLVLDNCEHHVDACAGIVETLLRGCPGLVVVATSREALGVMGETAWLVPPLQPSEAIQLFVDRARAVHPGFELTDMNREAVTEICRRLDGLPLAIELAAARIRVLPPEQIAERLSDAFRLLSAGSRTALPRHRTLRGAMDWSHALLSDREQALLRRLSVFAGSFSLDAVEAVCVGPPVGPDELLDSITTLVDKSLVILGSTDGEARYQLLGTVKQYGDEHLLAAGERDEMRARHAEFYLAMAERAAPRLFGGAVDRRLVSALVAETENLRAAGDWAMEDPSRLEQALRLASALHWFWFARGRFEEGRKRLSKGLSLSANVAPGVRSLALIALGHLHIWQGNPQAALPCMQEALILQQELDDPEGLAYALMGVGAGIYLSGDPGRCLQYFEAALPIAQKLPNRMLYTVVLYHHGRAAVVRGDHDLARWAFETATRTGRELGSTPGVAHPLVMAGRLACQEGRLGDAMAAFHESLTIHEVNEDPWGIVLCLEGIAQVTAARGLYGPAATIIALTEKMRERMAAAMWPTEIAEHDRLKDLLRGQLGESFDAAWIAGMGLDQGPGIRLALELTAPSPDVKPVVPVPAVPAPAPRRTPDLVVRALGPLQVFRDGERIEPGAWGSARPRELLVYLLLHPDGCTKEQVGLVFWPEASSAQVRNSFHVTLHRLRKALGHPEWIVPANDRYLLDPSLTVEFDATRFEQEITGTLKAGSADELSRALGLYQGDFLDGESAGDWHLEYRDRLQRLYVDGMTAWSGLLMAGARYGEAAEVSRRILARDPMHEESWRRLMVCHAQAGERAQAIRVYHQLADLLRREFESEPDPATTALFRNIQAGKRVQNA